MNMKINVVLDTSVIVSAFWSANGNPANIVKMFPEEITPHINDLILSEYKEVFIKAEVGVFTPRFCFSQIISITMSIASRCRLVGGESLYMQIAQYYLVNLTKIKIVVFINFPYFYEFNVEKLSHNCTVFDINHGANVEKHEFLHVCRQLRGVLW